MRQVPNDERRYRQAAEYSVSDHDSLPLSDSLSSSLTSPSQLKGRWLALLTLATAAIFLSFWRPSLATDCRSSISAVITVKANEEQIAKDVATKNHLHLLIAGKFARTFGRDFLAAVATDLGANGQKRKSVFDDVAIDIIEDLPKYLASVRENHGAHEILVILDSEFMNGQIPKYNELLSAYRSHKLKPDEIMLLDPFPPTWDQLVVVQITDEFGMQNAIYFVEIAMSLLIAPDLGSNSEFRDYALRATNELTSGQQVSDEFLQTRRSLILDCITDGSKAN